MLIPTRDHVVHYPTQSKDNYSRLLRGMSRWVLNISKDGDSTDSLGNLFRCLTTLTVKKFFLMFKRNFLCFSLCPLPFMHSLDITEITIININNANINVVYLDFSKAFDTVDIKSS